MDKRDISILSINYIFGDKSEKNMHYKAIDSADHACIDPATTDDRISS
jgi:hypothetical protein